MEPNELIDFSWCSQRTKKLVKSIKAKPSSFIINFDDRASVHLKFKNYSGIEWVFTVSVKTYLAKEDYVIEEQSYDGNTYYALYRKETDGNKQVYKLAFLYYPMEYGLKKWIEQFAFIFNSPIDKFVLDWKKDTRELVEWFFQIRNSVEKIHFVVHEMSHDDFRIVLNTVKTTKRLKLILGLYDHSVEWLNGFNHRNSKIFDTETLHISNAIYITFETLLDMSNCREIDLDGLTISDENLNEFLKLWINGHFPELESLEFGYREYRKYELNKIFDGIESIHDPHWKRYFENETASRLQKFSWDLAYNGWTIHDGNGTKATILIKKGISQEQYGFTFIVWTKDVSVTLE